MVCAWDSFLNLVPQRMREAVDRLGKNTLNELRMRRSEPPELVTGSGSTFLHDTVNNADLAYCINAASRYSPWSASTSADGYITASGGHRVGICGRAVMQNGVMTGITCPTSLCIRVARDYPGIAEGIPEGSVLIVGKPGSGKTTLLRDLIRIRSRTKHICVVDERDELFPVSAVKDLFNRGRAVDVLNGCGKAEGTEALLRCMSPDVIAVDEITAAKDCQALIHAGWCGVTLLATAHAGGREDLYGRPVYRPVLESGIFDYMVALREDKSWTAERISICT